MGQKETIVNLLKTNDTMTQGALAEAIYGDKSHGPNIYAALTGLVTSGVVLRTGRNPSYYSLSGLAQYDFYLVSSGVVSLIKSAFSPIIAAFEFHQVLSNAFEMG